MQEYCLNTDRRDQKKEAEKHSRQEQQRSDKHLALRRKNQQAEIDLMQEGADKKYAQLKLDYEIQIEELRKQEKKWREAQNGQLTEDQQAELDFGSQMADSEKQRETDDYLKGILSKYQGYIYQRQAIDEKYENDKRRLQQEVSNGAPYEGLR